MAFGHTAQDADVFTPAAGPISNQPFLPFVWMPRVDPARPEKKTFSLVANLPDDLRFVRQMHGTDCFLAEGRGSTQQRPCGMLDQVCLPRVRITPAHRAKAMDD